MRIVSLVPSATETLSGWDRTPIACTRFCERPDLLHIGGTKNPSIDDIGDLRPDLVVVDAEENRREDYDALISRGLDVFALHIRSLEDVTTELTGLAQRVGVRWAPPSLPRASTLHVSAFVPIWRRPWIALGSPTYGSSLLAHLGIYTVFASNGPYPTISLEEAAALRPDVTLAPSEPYPFTRRQLPELESVAPTVLIDGKDLFWWGIRTEGALHRLAEVLYDFLEDEPGVASSTGLESYE